MCGLVEGRQKQKEDFIVMDNTVGCYCGHLNSIVGKAG